VCICVSVTVAFEAFVFHGHYGHATTRPGWVSPGSVGSARTLQYMVDEGFLWNGDDASGDMPFVRWTGGKPLVIVPRVNFPPNDLIAWQRPQNQPSAYCEGFRETFDYLCEEGRRGNPKWGDLLLHCDLGGRPTLMPVFERTIRYALDFERVWFARRRDLARWIFEREPAQSS
jgi:hypothetical protein